MSVAPPPASPVIRIAARGDGVTADGRHVAGVAPGDLVAADGAIMPGPHHVAPVCRLFPRCGGCQLQQIDDAGLADYCRDRVVGALAAQGLEAGEVVPTHLSPPKSRRRAVMKAMRADGRVLLGFNEPKGHRIIDMTMCEVLEPALFALVKPLRTLLGPLLPRRGQAEVVMALADQGVDLLIKGVTAEGLAAHDALFDFAGGHALARLSIDSGDGPEDRWVPEPVTVTLGGVPVALPHGAFLQATRDGEAALLAGVRASIGEARAVADLFAGLGTFALPLAERARVTAVEGARDAALALRHAANVGQRPVTVEHRDLYRRPLTAKELRAFDAVVLDPPRAGAEAQVREIAASTVPHIAYVSCNPASFARDAAILAAGGYRIDRVQAVGQFRWSTHVELIAQLTRA